MRWPPIQLIPAVLWPAFVVAFVATAAVFAALDPEPLLECAAAWQIASLEPLGLYTVTFAVLWAAGALASLGAAFLLEPGAEPRPKAS